MITINLLDGIRTPLPMATPMEILEVCAAALAFCAVAALSSLELPIS